MVSAMLTWIVLPLSVVLAPSTDSANVRKFSADGETTYCRIAPDGGYASPYMGLTTASAGECPVKIELSVVATASFSMISSVFNVSWTATVNPRRSTAKFPVKPANEGLSARSMSVYACQLYSLCERDDLVYPSATTDRDTVDVENGAAIQLGGLQIDIPSAGDYILVGEITFDADLAAVNGVPVVVSSIVFQRVRASADGVKLPGTIRPPMVGFITPGATWTPIPTQQMPISKNQNLAGPEDSAHTDFASGIDDSSGHETLAVLLIGIVGLLAVVLFFVYAHKENEWPHDALYVEAT